MLRVNAEQLHVGMVVAEDVFTLNHQLLIPKGIGLTQNMIDMIKSYSIRSVRIDDSMLDEDEGDKIPTQSPQSVPDSAFFPSEPTRLPQEETISDQELLASLQIPRGFIPNVSKDVLIAKTTEVKKFRKEYDSQLHSFHTTINSLVSKNSSINIDRMLDNVIDLMNPAGNHINIVEMLVHMREYDDDVYAQSINVALLCYVLGGWLHFSDDELRMVTACGLFHDIGKLLISDQILKKPASLSPEEWAIMKTHTTKGYELLRQCNMDETICKAALMHHEKCDGTGYPHHLRGSQIDLFSKIVTISDIYNAMTSRRPYRNAFSPFSVIDSFEDDGLQKYDTRSIIVFLENTVNTYLNSPVKLSDGRIGYVVFINQARLGRPTVQVGKDFIDLNKHRDLYISEMVSIF